ncbi:SseB family protein [Micromonospora sp. NBC_01813]|uniref:SseB family protein n=1 Tax=Micromonospora sp. NBC_01813 TaxID=2975988 RepID=UPI002DD7DC37|nr:SseB family protein [Micromonospora sp. NBC_01813]WSA07249.1 SseB family protein [Micromonospora sp. NBC_01813]
MTAADRPDRADHPDGLAALGGGPLLLPVSAETAAGSAPFAWPTVQHDGQTHVLAFTSEQAIATALPGESVRYVTVELAEVAANLPDDSWILAVDPGSPNAARIPAGELRDLPSSGTTVEVAQALRAAILAEEPDALMAALLRAEFTVPLPPGGAGTGAPEPPGLSDPDFPWWCLPDEHRRPSVPVFTSPALMRQALGDTATAAATATSVQLFANWPDPSWQLAVNPGTPSAVSLPGSAVREVSGWLDELRSGGPTGDAPDPGPPDLSPPDPDVPDLSPPDPDAPLRMQVLIPHRYLHSYVSDGYDRIAGLVSRWYGRGRDTPRRLYARLGLLGPQSPFSSDDEWVPVIRWQPGPDTPSSWLDGSPQQHALVVPDGAGLHIVHQDGRDELLARFDAANHRWLPAQDGPAQQEPPPAA